MVDKVSSPFWAKRQRGNWLDRFEKDQCCSSNTRSSINRPALSVGIRIEPDACRVELIRSKKREEEEEVRTERSLARDCGRSSTEKSFVSFFGLSRYDLASFRTYHKNANPAHGFINFVSPIFPFQHKGSHIETSLIDVVEIGSIE